MKGFKMKHMLKRFLRNEEGATAIEYALITALVALAGIGAFTAFGDSLDTAFRGMGNTLGGAMAPPADDG